MKRILLLVILIAVFGNSYAQFSADTNPLKATPRKTNIIDSTIVKCMYFDCWDGNSYYTSGVYDAADPLGSGDIIRIHLTINTTTFGNKDTIIYIGEIMDLGGGVSWTPPSANDTTVQYREKFHNDLGCDSVVIDYHVRVREHVVVEKDMLLDNEAEISWSPYPGAKKYRLDLYVKDEVKGTYEFNQSLDVAAVSETGYLPAPRRVRLDEVGSTIILTIDPNSGKSAKQPIKVKAQNTAEQPVDCRFIVTMINDDEVEFAREEIAYKIDAMIATSLENAESGVSSVTIYDMMGRQHFGPVNMLPKGIYILHSAEHTKKIVVE